jgi:hypothetical protein
MKNEKKKALNAKVYLHTTLQNFEVEVLQFLAYNNFSSYISSNYATNEPENQFYPSLDDAAFYDDVIRTLFGSSSQNFITIQIHIYPQFKIIISFNQHQEFIQRTNFFNTFCNSQKFYDGIANSYCLSSSITLNHSSNNRLYLKQLMNDDDFNHDTDKNWFNEQNPKQQFNIKLNYNGTIYNTTVREDDPILKFINQFLAKEPGCFGAIFEGRYVGDHETFLLNMKNKTIAITTRHNGGSWRSDSDDLSDSDDVLCEEENLEFMEGEEFCNAIYAIYCTIKKNSQEYENLTENERCRWEICNWNWGLLDLSDWNKDKLEMFEEYAGEFDWRAKRENEDPVLLKMYEDQNRNILSILEEHVEPMIKVRMYVEEAVSNPCTPLDDFRQCLYYWLLSDAPKKESFESTTDPPVTPIMLSLEVDKELLLRFMNEFSILQKEEKTPEQTVQIKVNEHRTPVPQEEYDTQNQNVLIFLQVNVESLIYRGDCYADLISNRSIDMDVFRRCLSYWRTADVPKKDPFESTTDPPIPLITLTLKVNTELLLRFTETIFIPKITKLKRQITIFNSSKHMITDKEIRDKNRAGNT